MSGESDHKAGRLSWRVTRVDDAIWTGAEAKRLGRLAGLGDRACAELGIAVGELVANAVVHAGGGQVALERVEEPRPGVRVVVRDRGPGIPEPSQALQDGFTTRGGPGDGRSAGGERRGLGLGLGAAQRLLDRLEIQPREGGGVRVTGLKLVPVG